VLIRTAPWVKVTSWGPVTMATVGGPSPSPEPADDESRWSSASALRRDEDLLSFGEAAGSLEVAQRQPV